MLVECNTKLVESRRWNLPTRSKRTTERRSLPNDPIKNRDSKDKEFATKKTVILKPETVIAWHRQGLRLAVEELPCRWAEPSTSVEVRDLIRQNELGQSLMERNPHPRGTVETRI